MSQEIKEWLAKHKLPENLEHVVRGVPMNVKEEDDDGNPIMGRSTTIAIRLEYLGNKFYLNENQEQDIVDWLRLTHKLLM